MKDRLLFFREQTHAQLTRWLGNDLTILIFGGIVGAAGGGVAALFGAMVESTARLAWGEGEGGRSWLGMLLLVLVPTVGGVLVGAIQTYGAKTGPTHGIPEIVTAVVRKQGVIPFGTGAWKALTASLTLGSGGCAGMEGPVVTIGAAAGSGVGRLIGVKRGDLPVLVGCGMAAAIAAAFNAPIAGVLFVLEVILCDFSLRLFMPIVVASVVGTVASQGLGDALFSATHGEGHGALFLAEKALAARRSTLAETPVYVLLGLLCGVLGFAMTWVMQKSEVWWKRAPGPVWLRPGLGGLALGVLGLSFGLMLPHGDGILRNLSGQGLPAFMGNGYSVIASLFKPGHFDGAASYTAGILLFIVALKLLGVGLTLGSGGSGGAIAPSLFVGAAAGGCVGCIAQWTGWFPHMTPATYALVGMAGVIASAFRCPLTAFVLVFELTHDYAMILPAMVVAILAVTIARRMGRESLVALQLREKGVRSGHGVAILRRSQVSEIALAQAHFLNEKDEAVCLLRMASNTHADDFVVQSADGQYRGMIFSDRVREVLLDREALPLLIIGDLMDPATPTVLHSETLESVMEKFSQTKAHCLPVRDDRGRVLGLMTHERLMSHYHQIAAQD